MMRLSTAHSDYKVWFTSDHHFGHRNIIRLCGRPFRDIHHMHETMVENWNNVVSQRDLVIVVGDFSLSTKDMEAWTHRLNGRKCLVAGNHDVVHSCHRHAAEKQQNTLDKYRIAGWEIITEEMMLETQYGDFYIRHLPYLFAGDVDIRYRELRTVEPHHLICGHVHTAWTTKRHPNGYVMINVGVDVTNFKPISIDDIAALLRKTL